MKLPLWAQVQVERALDELKPGCVEIHFNGTGEIKIKTQITFTKPTDRPAGMTEY